MNMKNLWKSQFAPDKSERLIESLWQQHIQHVPVSLLMPWNDSAETQILPQPELAAYLDQWSQGTWKTCELTLSLMFYQSSTSS